MELRVDEPEKCGFGAGEECCAFLMLGGIGFVCGRTNRMEPVIRARLIAGTMNAKYDPGDKPFPECQPKGNEHVAS